PSPALAGALTFLYLSFAAFLAAMLAGRVQSPTCGCLGRRDAPATRLHVVMDLAGAAVALMAMVWTPRGLFGLMPHLPLVGLPYAAALVASGYLSYLAVASLPHLFFSYRG